YTITTNDLAVGADTSGGSITLMLPTASASSNLCFIIKDEGGASTANPIVIALQGADTLDGLSGYGLTNNNSSLIIRSRGGTKFEILGSHKINGPGDLSDVQNVGSGVGLSKGALSGIVGLKSLVGAGFATVSTNSTNATITGLQSGETNT